jgi:prevent-host-death family protein
MYNYSVSISMEPEREIAVSDARARLAELVDEAESGVVTYLTRHGHRLAAIVPAELPAAAGSAQVRAFARQFAANHPRLLERLAE